MKSKVILIIFMTISLIILCNSGIYAAKVGEEVTVGGMPFGIKFYTEGVLVCGISDVDVKGGNKSPGEAAGVKKGDIITEVNSEKVETVNDIINHIRSSQGNALKLTVIRGTKNLNLKITPLLSESENEYKTGLWIKDGTAGIGTVTYIDKDDNSFGGLGHGVCDSETSELLKMRKADVCDVIISSIKKGIPDEPGALQGMLSEAIDGHITDNTDHGVYGIFECDITDSIMDAEIAAKNELSEGSAYILCTLDNNNICKYEIEIEKIFNNSEKTKNFLLRVTDDVLLSKTGGIVQGMSGSPIIQNGKLVGAVTHVLVEDPSMGYGIFIENML